jgi:methylmalonyl-CoA mutase N-terminal domain/subunit
MFGFLRPAGENARQFAGISRTSYYLPMTDDARSRWQARYDAALAGGRTRTADYTTLSGMTVEPAYGTEDSEWPGEFPFTRGLYPTGYRGRTWTIRQFAGFGNAEQTNERYRMILGRGGGGLSVAFDMPTLMGRDSDDRKALGEVGHCGVAIDSAADMERLFKDIDLGAVTTSMTISGPAVPVFCMMIVAAERAGVDTKLLNGTLQTDIFKEYIAQKEWLFGPEPHLRLIGDLMEYCAEEIPAYKPLSVSGYHIREAGSTAAQELAFTLADGFGYVELGLARGLDVDVFAPGLSFFFDAHVDFFEEIAKFRAARRIWARWMRDVYGARSEKAQWLRFHTQTAGVSLTAQQPYNNVVRTGIEALAAVLGGTNSLHTNALDETLALPSEQAAEIALRTQQVIMEETGVVNVADPLGGSWYVEALTDQIEAEANLIFDKILAMGGAGNGGLTHADTEALAAATKRREDPVTKGLLRGIEEGWFMSEIAEAAFTYQIALEKGEKRIVGVNTNTESVTHDLEILRVSHEVEVEQVRVLAERRAHRDEAAVRAALAHLVDVARTDGNMIEPMLEACRVEATLGEICDALRAEWGEYREPARF